MDHTLFRYDEPYGRGRRKGNPFAWTIAILLLIGLAFATWLSSLYIFSQPERPDSYRILQKLHKLEQPKRFQLTAAPAGEFLSPKQLHERYGKLGPAELARTNAELIRNYIRNYSAVRGAVPYVVGRFTIMEARELGPNDLFTTGMVALGGAVDYGEVLLEHVYPADAQSVPLMQETLATGLEMKLERAHDLSAIIHAEHLSDGRLLLTAVPLLYGSYTVTQGRGMFSLEPPYDLNMAAGWPIFKSEGRRAAEAKFASYRERYAPAVPGISIPGVGPSATPVATNELVRVETAVPVQTPTAAPLLAKSDKAVKATPTPAPAAKTAKPEEALPALPVKPDTALASTAGGGTWKTYPAGKMPAGRLITTSDLGDVAERGLAGERVYLRGQFVVNFAEGNRAVLRPKSNMAESVLHLGAPSSTRIVVEFPAGHTPPAPGSTVTRDQAQPYEITEVRKQSDGQLNVFVREIMQ